MRSHRLVRKSIVDVNGKSTTVLTNPEKGVPVTSEASKRLSNSIPTSSSVSYPYPGAEEPKEQALGLFRMDDAEESAANHVIAMCDVIYAHGGDVPERFQYRPSPMLESAREALDKTELDNFGNEWPDEEYHSMLSDGEVSVDSMIEAASAIHDSYLAEDKDDRMYDFEGDLNEDAYKRKLALMTISELEGSIDKLEDYGNRIPSLEKMGAISKSRFTQHRSNHESQFNLTQTELTKRLDD